MCQLLVIIFLAASAFGQESGDSTGLPLTREALWQSFPADIREMVYRWDRHDPRSEEERRRALFDFMYEGFDSAAWVPLSLFQRKELLAPFGDPEAIVRAAIGSTSSGQAAAMAATTSGRSSGPTTTAAR